MKNFYSTFFKSKTIFLAILAITILTTPAFFQPTTHATSAANSTSATITLPSRSDLKRAISRLESIENYHAYREINPAQLDQTTPFAKEYRYLFNLVDAANALLIKYDYADPREASILLTAMNDAYIACNLRFGTMAQSSVPQSSNSQTSTSQTPQTIQSQPSQPSQSPTHPVVPPSQSAPTPSTAQSAPSSHQSAPIQPAVATTSTTYPSAPSFATATVSATIPNNFTTDDTTTDDADHLNLQDPIDADNQSASNDLEVPATGSTNESSSLKALPYIIVAATAIFAILCAIILSRRRSYRPSRKVR